MNLIQFIYKKIQKYRYPLLLLLACIIGYFEITFFILTPKWDNIDAFLPYRHVVGTWISNGHLPLWNPYQLLGYPTHSDPQSGAWYPLVWLLGLVNDYDLYSINIELSLHYFIGGLGMFTLGRTLKIKDSIAFIMGMTYMFSGFMVGTSQILVMIIAAAWLPFSINYLLVSLKNPTFKNLFLLAFINFLLVTGSYPAMTIILFYIYATIAIYYFYQYFKKQFSLKTILIVFGGQTVLLLMLTGGYFYSIYEMLPYMDRAGGIPYSEGLFTKVGFPIQGFISFLLPYATVSDTLFFKSDMTMINGYFGLFSVVFILYGLIFYRDKKLITLFLLAVIILLIAAGMQLPFHYFLYNFLPGFNLFRHPSIFRVYAIFILIIASGYSLQHYTEDPKKFKNISLIIKMGMAFFILIVIVGAIRTNYSLMPEYFNALIHLKERSPLNFSGHILIQGTIQLIFLTIALFLANNGKLNTKKIIYLVFLDLFLATQLNAPRTIFYTVRFNELQEYIEAKPHQLTNQTLEDDIIDINNKSVKPKQRGVWKNLNSYAKRTAYDGYNPVKFNDFMVLREESGIMDNVLNNPLFYIPDKIYSYPLKEKTMNRPRQAFLSADLYSVYNKNTIKGSLTDLKIDYNGFSVKSEIINGGLIFLNQNYHHNWHAYIDGDEVKIQKANIALMAIEIPPGNHEVIFKYKSMGAIIGFIISVLTIAMGFFVILFQSLKLKHKKRAPYTGTPLSYH